MGLARTTDDKPRPHVGFSSALIFNASLVALALSSARLAIEYSKPNLYTYEISDENLRNTKAAIEATALKLPPPNVDRRTYWGALVKTALDETDLDAAKGYLLLTPQFLTNEDGPELQRALKDPRLEAIKTRSADARMIEAGALLLPKDAQLAWVEATTEPEPIETFLADPIKSITDFASNLFKPKVEIEPPADPFELDDSATLVQTTQLRALGKPINNERFKLNAFAVWLPGTSIMDSGDGSAVRKAVSVLQGAKALKTIQPGVQEIISTKLQAALPDAKLDPALRVAISNPSAAKDPQLMARSITKAFETSADIEHSRDLAIVLKQVNSIATATSPQATAKLLSFAHSKEDLQKLQLASQAGGLRLVALSRTLNAETLTMAKGKLKARTGIDLSLWGMIASIAGMVGILIYTLTQAIRRKLDEHEREKLAPQH